MSRRWPPPALLALAVLAVLLGWPAGAPSAGAWPVGAQVPGGEVVAVASLTSVSPAAPDADEEVTISGVVRNVGDAPLGTPTPALRWSSDPIQSTDELDLVAQNPLFRYGRADYRFSPTLDTLEPGEDARFTLRVPLGALGVQAGVYVLGVDVLATLPAGPRVFVASARTTVPVGIAVEDRVPVAMLWPLAARPSLLPDGRLLDEDMAEAVAPSGRLTTLVDAAAGSPVTWVVDPDVVATAAAMVNGYAVARPPSEGEGAAAAAAFLAGLAGAIAPAADVWQIPAADPDVGGWLAAGGRPDQVARALADGTGDPAVADLVGRPVPAMALLSERPVTTDMLAAYRSGEVDLVALSPDAVTTLSPDTAPGLPTAALGTARVDIIAGDGVPTPGVLVDTVGGETDSGPSAVSVRQDLLSRTALLAGLDSPPTGLVLRPPPGWTPDLQVASALLTAWQEAGWIEPRALGDLRAAATAAALVPNGAPDPLPGGIVETLASVAVDAARLRPLFVDPVLESDRLPRSEARATSYAWRTDPGGAEDYTAELDAIVSDVEQQLEIVLSPSVTLSSRSGRFPVTLVNGSASDVAVGVRFDSQNSSRLRVEDIEPVVLAAGEKRTLTATALATANGRVPVSASLVTTEGGTVSSPAGTSVDVTNVGALGWTVIVAGGVLFAAALLRARWRRGRHEAATSPGQPEHPVEVGADPGGQRLS